MTFNAPMLDAGGAPQCLSVAEGVTHPAGMTVADLVIDGSITHDGGAAVEAIAITALDTRLGSWQYSLDGGTHWLTIRADLINSATNELALLLGPTAMIRLLPFGGLSGTLADAITFRAWDPGRGTQGEYAVIDGVGGASAFSTESETASVTVTPVDAAPSWAVPDGTGRVGVPGLNAADAKFVLLQPDGKIILGDGVRSLARLNADGSLDTGFGSGGVAQIPTGSEVFPKGVLQPDGKIVLVGNDGSQSFAIRLNADGTPDPGFSGDGSTPFSMRGEMVASSVALQADGKVVLSGYRFNPDIPGASPAVMRLNADGTLDTGFGDGGLEMLPVRGWAHAATVQPDGRIIVAGIDDSGTLFSITRLNADGSPDSGFDYGGAPSGFAHEGFSVVLQPDGKIVVAGGRPQYGNSFALVRLNADGSLDSGFSDDGTVLLPVGVGHPVQLAHGVVLQPDGKLLVAGAISSDAIHYDLAVLRLNPDGSLDTGFADGGTTIVATGVLGRYDLQVQPDGKIVVTGGGSGHFSAIRLHANGTPDTTFGSGPGLDTLGGVIQVMPNGSPVALDASVAIHDADFAALDGGVGNYAGASVTLARHGGAAAEDQFSALGNLRFSAGDVVLSGVHIGTYANANGTLAIAFNGNATQARVNDALSSIGYASASATAPATVRIDWTFRDGTSATTGSTTVNVNDAPVLDATASLSLPAVLEGATSPAGISVASLVADGSISDANGAVAEAIAITALDTRLGTWQYRLDGGSEWLTIRADLINEATTELALLLGPTAMIRLLPFGGLGGTLADAITFRAWDRSIGAQGEYRVIAGTGGGHAFSAASDTASLTVTPVNAAPSWVVPDGTGWSTAPGLGLQDAQFTLLQPDGKMIVGDRLGYLVRLQADGSLDTGFGTWDVMAGVVPNALGGGSAWAGALQPDGKILLTGQRYEGGSYVLTVARLNADGTPDAGFAGDGVAQVSPGGLNMGAYRLALQPDGKIVVAGVAQDSATHALQPAVVRFNADGTLDSGFGDAGVVLGGAGLAEAVTVQPDGRIILAGAGSWGMSVIRLNADGSPDSGFADGAQLLVASGTLRDGMASSVVLQPDGKIVLAGRNFNGSDDDFALVRLNADGSPDASFSGDGAALVPIGLSHERALSVHLLPDGRFVVAGSILNGDGYDIAVVRLQADGSLDTAFGDGGKVIVPLGIPVWINDIDTDIATVQPDGKILLSGGPDFATIRLHPDGALDTTFGSGPGVDTLGGVLQLTENDAPVALDVAVAIHDAEMAVLDGGAGNYAGASVTLARHGGAATEDQFSARGNLAFSAGDVVLSGVVIGTYTNAGGTLAIAFNGHATQARVNEALSSIGYANTSDTPAASVQIDWTFSDGTDATTGRTTVNIAAVDDAPVLDASASLALPDVLQGAASPAGITVGDLVADGSITDAYGALPEAIAITALDTRLGSWQYSLDGGAHWLTIRADLINSAANELALLLGPTALIRLLPFGDLSGTMQAAIAFRAWDLRRGTEGEYTVVAGGGGDHAFSAASDTASLTVTAAANSAPSWVVPDGTGRVWVPSGNLDQAQFVLLQPDGKLVLAGLDWPGTGVTPVVRLNADGSLDTGFGSGGEAQVAMGTEGQLWAAALQPDGSIVLAGVVGFGGNTSFAVARLNPDGTPDWRFSDDGQADFSMAGANAQANAIALQPDGKIVLAGFRSDLATRVEYPAVMRLNADGTLDGAFGTGGTQVLGHRGWGTAVAVQPDGRILVVAASATVDNGFCVTRLNADGSLDSGFAEGGTLLLPSGMGQFSVAYGVVLQPDGKIVLAGHASNGSNADFALVRLNADGSLDATFSGDGEALLPMGLSDEVAYSVHLLADGRLVVAGTSYDGESGGFAAARLHADGSLDTGFGDGGKLMLPLGATNPDTYTIAVQPDGRIVVAGGSDFTAIRLLADGTLDTTFGSGPGVDALGDELSVMEDGSPVALDATAAIRDAEMARLDDGAGNYAGAGVTLARHGGASAEDHFSALGDLHLASGDVLLAGVRIGTYTNAGGTLAIAFNGNATQARVNEALSNIGYAHASDTPPASVQIDWTFSDGTAATTGSTTVNITPVDDAPTAVDVSARVDEDGVIAVTLAGSDPDSPVAYRLSTQPAHGTLYLDADGTQAAPIGTDLAGATLYFRPAADWSGSTSFDYLATSGALSALATGSITVDPVNDAPVAADASARGDEDSVIAVMLPASDVDGTIADYTLTALPGHGTLYTDAACLHPAATGTAYAGATLYFRPAADWNGSTSFTYTARDDGGAVSGAATARLTVDAVNDLPVAAGVSVSAPEGDVIPVTLSGTDTEGAIAGYTVTALPAHGTLYTDAACTQAVVAGTAFPGATLYFRPATGFLGGTSFGYLVTDGDGASNGAAVTATIAVVNAAPVLDAAASPSLPDMTQGVPDPGGVAVASLVTGADAIAITALDTALGTWQYSLDGGTHWLAVRTDLINSATNELALLLGPAAMVRMVPFGELHGTLPEAITFRAWDRTEGAEGQYTVITATGGASAFSAESGSASLTVTGTGSAPSWAAHLGSGKLVLPVGTGSDHARSVQVQPDGKIILAGPGQNGGFPEMAVIRLNADGSPDAGFGTAGTAFHHANPGANPADEAYAALLQPDGKILLAGSSMGSPAVIRLNSDGTPDTGFSGDGRVAFLTESGVYFSAALQTDGSIVLGGLDSSGGGRLAVTRLHADGSLDTGFGDGGKKITPFGGIGESARSVTLQPDGKILVTGAQDATGRFPVARLNADGSLDASFGTGGQLTLSFGAQVTSSGARAILTQPDGKILITGTYEDHQFAVIRLNADGSPDTRYGADGRALFDVLSGDALGAALQSDGKLVLAGHAWGRDYELAVVRLNVDGTPDAGFGTGGKVLIPLGTDSTDFGYGVSVQPDGRIVLAGFSNAGGDPNFAVVRLNADGSLDTRLGATSTLGEAVTYAAGSAPVALDGQVAIRDAEFDALDGGAGNYAGASVTLARHGGAVAEDQFSARGNLAFSAGDVVLSGVVIGTYTNAGGTLAIAFNGHATQARVNEALSSIGYANTFDSRAASVQIDWTFSDGTNAATASTPVHITAITHAPVLDASASPALPDVLQGAASPAGITVAELVADGSITDPYGALPEAIAITALDTGLGSWQYSLDGGAHWLTIHADLINSTTNELALLLGPTALIRLLPFGDLGGTLPAAITFRAWDPGRGTEGEYTVIDGTGGGNAFSAASDTASLTVTAAANTAPSWVVPDGTGRIQVSQNVHHAQFVLLQPDGGMVLAGDVTRAFGQTPVVRLQPDGRLEAGFGSGGVTPAALGLDMLNDGALQADGRIVLAGAGGQGFAVVRLNADGTPDPGFSGDGHAAFPLGGFSSGNPGDMALQPDGKIVLAGHRFDWNTRSESPAVMRVNADGTLDAAFGDGGLQLLGDPGRVMNVAVQPDGKIVLACLEGQGALGDDSMDFYVTRLNADGTPDSGFGEGGKRFLAAGLHPFNDSYDLLLQPDGKIVLSAAPFDGSGYGFGLIRLNADGSVDDGFAFDGQALTEIGLYGQFPFSVQTLPDGKFIVVATATISGWFDVGVVRLHADGSVDTGFADGGMAIVPVGGSLPVAYVTTVQPDGSIVVAGGPDFTAIRLHADGTPDTTFGSGPGVDTLGGTVTYARGGAAVALDGSVAIFDAEMGALAGGAGNYDGASVRLERAGGASAQDQFFALGNLAFSDGAVVLSGVTVGSTTQAGGTLSIAFNGHATQARVNEVLSSIGYANGSSTPPVSVQIDWTFDDGQDTTTGRTTVQITGLNQAPGGALAIVGRAEVGQTLVADASAIADPDGLGTFVWQWLRDGVAIAGATAASHTLTADDLGARLAVVASWIDGGAVSESVTSDLTASVAPDTTPPVPGTLALANRSSLLDPTFDLTLRDHEAGTTVAYEISTDGGLTWAATAVAQVALAAGEYRFRAQVTDAAGNQSASNVLAVSVPNVVSGATAGADTLSGLQTGDGIAGGRGDDTYFIDAPGVSIVETASGGVDRVISSVDHVLASHVEHLELVGSAASGTGNGLANRIDGHAADNHLSGMAGNDTLAGAAGNDTLDGGTGHDRLEGGAGDDSLLGGPGNDWLDGGEGADALAGGAGHDRYVVDSAADSVTELPGEGRDTVHTALASHTLAAFVENLVYTGGDAFAGTGNAEANALTGGAGADTLVGEAGNDTLNGGAGADQMAGGRGNDTYGVDDAGDVVVEEAGQGNDTVRTALAHYTLDANVEVLVYSGSAAFDGRGNALNNRLVGGAGDDTLFGDAGADHLRGGAGSDRLTGGAGADVFHFDSAADTPVDGPDVVTDFSAAQRDRIDLRLLDADAFVDGHQAFVFIGTAAFTEGAAQAQLRFDSATSRVYGSTDADAEPEFAIELAGVGSLTVTSFLL